MENLPDSLKNRINPARPQLVITLKFSSIYYVGFWIWDLDDDETRYIYIYRCSLYTKPYANHIANV